MSGADSALGYRRVVTERGPADLRLRSGEDSSDDRGFAVSVDGFEGPFDLLMSLIAKHKLEVTALALHQVTDDFIRHTRAQGDDWDLGESTQFLVVAAILLDLKASRLLPGREDEDIEDLAALEAQDLLLARLMQYRAFKEVSALFDERLNSAQLRQPRTVGLDPQLADLLPEVVVGIGVDGLAALAIRGLTPVPPPQINVDHVYAPLVSVPEQAAIVAAQLRRSGSASFSSLLIGCPDTAHVVARFLALLDLCRQALVSFDQARPLTELIVKWTGTDEEGARASG